jgi:hypothetical protein
MSLLNFATDMSAKKKPYISDRVTARKAKVYIYGFKEKRKLEAVTATNIYLEECMNPHTITQSSTQYSIIITITRALTVAFWLTLFVVYMYTVYAFLIK